MSEFEDDMEEFGDDEGEEFDEFGEEEGEDDLRAALELFMQDPAAAQIFQGMDAREIEGKYTHARAVK